MKMRVNPILAWWLVLGLLAAAPRAEALEPGLIAGESGTVVEIVDGDTLILDTGTEVRLVGLQAPKLPLGRHGFIAWPLSSESKQALSELTEGRRLTLSHGGRRRDRYGRALAHLHDTAGLWIQAEMLRLGMARVYSFPDNRKLVDRMLRLERDARQARRGIWGHPFYRVRNPPETWDEIDSFQIVEGRVVAAAVVKGIGYLNFGKDWRRDFTFSIRSKARRLFRKAGVDIESLTGRRVRGRGWVKLRNGPMIELTHPEQLEILEE